METLFTTPNLTKSNWINTNDANVDLSEIRIVGNECILKYDTLHDLLLYDDTIQYSATFLEDGVHFPLSMYKLIRDCRIRSYRACIWYPLVKNKIPTSKSKIIEFKNCEIFDDTINKIISTYSFVRLCTMSPKDLCCPIYENWNDAKNSLISSERTGKFILQDKCIDKNNIHLFLRKIKNFIWECRCFWSHSYLTAVSLDEGYDFSQKERDQICVFFEQYGSNFPYRSAIVDIGFTNEIELIEFNSFGPDLNATSGKFSWIEDAYDLHFSRVTIFR